MIAIDLSKQQALNADPKTIRQIHFTRNLDQAGKKTMFLVIDDAKELWEYCKYVLQFLLL